MLEPLKSRPKELKGMKPTVSTKAKDYYYSITDFYIYEDAVYINWHGYRVKGQWAKIDSYKKYLACDVIRNCPDMGRNFEDGVLKLWHREGLNIYTPSLLKTEG